MLVPALATQAMTLQSWVLVAEAIRTTAPFQQETSKRSNAQPRFAGGATIVAWWTKTNCRYLAIAAGTLGIGWPFVGQEVDLGQGARRLRPDGPGCGATARYAKIGLQV